MDENVDVFLMDDVEFCGELPTNPVLDEMGSAEAKKKLTEFQVVESVLRIIENESFYYESEEESPYEQYIHSIRTNTLVRCIRAIRKEFNF